MQVFYEAWSIERHSLAEPGSMLHFGAFSIRQQLARARS
jgi:hypothetical protein